MMGLLEGADPSNLEGYPEMSLPIVNDSAPPKPKHLEE